MPRARKRKNTAFEAKQTKAVFLYGKPNKEKYLTLDKMQAVFCDLVNEDIRIITGHPEFTLQLVKNDHKDGELRQFEKTVRPDGINSAFCQAAFDMAVTHLSNRLNAIRLDMYSHDQTILTQSKVLFAISVMENTKEEMASVMEEIANGKDGFYMDCMKELRGMGPERFQSLMLQFQDDYAMTSLEYQIPVLSRAELPLNSKLMTIEPSKQIQAPFVISVADPFRKWHRISIPLDTSSHSLHKIHSNQMAATVMASVKDGNLRITWSYQHTMEHPATSDVIGLDTGILDLFHSSDNKTYSSMKEAIRFYQEVVEPAFAERAKLRSKQRKICHYLRKHPDLPEDVRRSLIQKMDRLEHMIQTMNVPYRKKRHYYAMLDKTIKDGVSAYISDIRRDILTAIERLDIKEFHKSRKANGMFSVFARGKAQQALMKTLNWKGYDFVEVEPEYTSQLCPVCSNLDKANRDGKQFLCTCCGYHADADHVGGINIRARVTDPELMEVCGKDCHSKKALRIDLQEIYKARNEKYKQQHPAATAAVHTGPPVPQTV